MPSLYELTENYKRFLEYSNDALDEEGIEEDEIEMLIDNLDAIQDTIENKVENIAKFLKNIEGDIAAYKTEEDRLKKNRTTLENKHERLKLYTQQMLELAGIEKLKTPLFNVRIQKNNASVLITDASKIPAAYRVPQPDKIVSDAILKALKSGQVVEGAEFAPEKKHIRFS
ncbi:hypothetical protein A9X05_09140 [Mycobacterium sp. E3298]|nr:siphovirus Gp157 family protein [Mycobacterium sp. E3298]OBG93858.1 hypothetical protein A9X05_09140 [Mycobacterium sp. E3298]